MRVSEAMTRSVDLVPSDATVRGAATMMAEHDIGAVLVGTAAELAGILTDRDIIVRVVVKGRDPGQTAVREVMSADLYACGPDDRIEDALALMEERQVRRLPVRDAEGVLLGVVTRSDLIKRVAAQKPSPPAAA